MINQKYLTQESAYAYLLEANKMNPGPWFEHSKNVALAAGKIASAIGLDPQEAEALGYIHDIGRRYGISKMRHVIDGYNFMIDEGYPQAARICLTHSFPTFNIKESVGEWDCSDEEYSFVENYIARIQITKMDKLIQLCDAIALPSGITMIERRLMDVTLRYGVDSNTLKRWKSFLLIQKEFEDEINASLNSIFPDFYDSVISQKIEDVYQI